MTRTVAVIGSGMAGLAAAYFCRKASMQVTVFEARQGFGMDTHSLALGGGHVDVPLRVMSPGGWTSVLALADELGVETFEVDTFVACSDLEGRSWFRSGRMPVTGWPFVGSWRYLTPRSLRLARGLSGLARAAADLPADGSGETLGEFIERQRLHPEFWRGLLLPLLITICTCDERHLLAWPAGQLLARLQDILHGPRLLRLKGGTSALVRGLSRDLVRISGSPVVRVEERSHGRVDVYNARGDGGPFDCAVIATQANHLDFLVGERLAAERERLAGIPYAGGELVVHGDRRFMPARRSDWPALHFQAEHLEAQPIFTVWVNAVEPTLHGREPVFQTWNPTVAPDPETVSARVALQRAVVTPATAGILGELAAWHAAPDRRVFYCGSWASEGVPLLETAVRSARAVADRLSRQERGAAH